MKVKEFKVHRTHIAQVRDENADQVNEICQLLGWTHEQYCEHQFYNYQWFVYELTKGWPAVRREIEYSPVFRGFWNNEATFRNDTDFLPFAYDCKYDHWYMLEEYVFIHDFNRLLNDEVFMARYEHIRGLI